jgi:hypothetical protein
VQELIRAGTLTIAGEAAACDAVLGLFDPVTNANAPG